MPLGKNPSLQRALAGMLFFFAALFLRFLPAPLLAHSALTPLLVGALAAIWALSLRARTPDPGQRRLFLLLVGNLMLLLLLQSGRCAVFSGDATAQRLLLYAYFLPLSALPLVSLVLAHSIRRPGAKLPGRYWLMGAALLLALAFLTNDLHHRAFSFPPGAAVRRGPLCYLELGWNGVLYCLCLVCLGRPARPGTPRRGLLAPALVLLGSALLLALCLPDRMPRVGGSPVLELPELCCFTAAAFWESCLQGGLVPSNNEYERFFDLASFSAEITDREGRLVRASAAAIPLSAQEREAASRGPLLMQGDTLLQYRPIRGGGFYWTDDRSLIRRLNGELTEATQRLSEENELKRAENALQEERVRTQTMNRIYDEIAALVRGQVERMGALLNQEARDEESFRRNLAQAVFLNTYIKRRGNLRLLSLQQDVTFGELFLAMRESLEALRLGGVPTALTRGESFDAPQECLIAAYDCFEALLEGALEGMEACYVHLSGERASLRFRLLLDHRDYAPDLEALNRPLRPLGGALTLEREGDSLLFSFTLGWEARP